jgi:hypothetical protein
MRGYSDLRPYQDRVISRLYESTSLLAVLDMGAGKTICALTAIAELIQFGEIRRALVIAPKRVAELVWRQEAEAWGHTHKLRCGLLAGSVAARRAILNELDRYDVLICGVDNVQWLVAELPADAADLLVIDETSRMRNPTSKRAKALLSIIERFNTVWGLTGTPRPNSDLDLFMPMSLLTKRRLWGRSFYRWRQERFHPVDWNQYDWRPLPGTSERIQREIEPYAITLKPGDMPGLPDLNIVVSYVELPFDLRAEYNRMERELFADLADNGEIVVADTAAIATGKLAQIAQGFMYIDTEDERRVTAGLHELKLDWIEELVAELDGEPLIICYEFLEDKRRILDRLPYAMTLDQNSASVIEAWNARQLPVLLIHPASAGHGLNLQAGGHHMAWYGLPWSAELWDQTIKRLHRPGQGQPVTVSLCLVTNTVDEMKRWRVVDKLTAQDAFRRYLATV